MKGDMQRWTPNVASIIEHAKELHPTTEIVSRMISGEIHKTTYDEVCIPARKLASALEKDGYTGHLMADGRLETYMDDSLVWTSYFIGADHAEAEFVDTVDMMTGEMFA